MSFKPLSNVFDAVVHANTPEQLKFVSQPTESPVSKGSNSTRLDAYLLLVEKNGIDAQLNKKSPAKNSNPDSWNDIAVSLQFKKGNGDVEGNADDKKVIWSLHYIMHRNPCRCTPFGVTIENTGMRSWCTCRAVTLLSKSFDSLTEPENLIYFFASLAVTNDHELGLEPTICIRGNTRYDVTVCIDERSLLVYQTTTVIPDFNADSLRGCGTRIFVCLKSQDGQPVKDAELVLVVCWGDSDQDREGRIFDQIFVDLRDHNRIKQVGETRKYFLSVLAAGNMTVDGKVGGTDSLLRMSNLPTDYPLLADELPGANPTKAGEGPTPCFLCVPGPAKQSKVHHRIHSHLVFKEACQPVHEPRGLGTVFETLQDAHKGWLSCNMNFRWWLAYIQLLALQFSYGVKWVHRDVSAGNVLRASGTGKSADAGCAKCMDFKTTHDVRTGTLDFMACEVEAQNYLFTARRHTPYGTTFEPRFRFNPLHDMESIRWIAVWVLFYHVDQEGNQPSSDQTQWFNHLFRGRLGSRLSTFCVHIVYQVLPATFHRPACEIEIMRQELIMAYINSEEDMPPAEEPAYIEPLANLHSFTKFLTSVVEYSRGVSLFRPMIKRLETRDNTQAKVRRFRGYTFTCLTS
ncbi:hypothetical protein EDC04DRAFT_1249687 [Pisolithus marmoratus]|nr:hypothetical protein EDC04DRAFT_1249687 [Pisolithus marmoratus]